MGQSVSDSSSGSVSGCVDQRMHHCVGGSGEPDRRTVEAGFRQVRTLLQR